MVYKMEIFGPVMDNETRCIHYHTEKDIIAIKFACCERYYPCYKCHEEHAKHAIKRWQQSQFNVKAILCGHCKHELTIQDYMESSSCPQCMADFNPRCANHYAIYFEM